MDSECSQCFSFTAAMIPTVYINLSRTLSSPLLFASLSCFLYCRSLNHRPNLYFLPSTMNSPSEDVASVTDQATNTAIKTFSDNSSHISSTPDHDEPTDTFAHLDTTGEMLSQFEATNETSQDLKVTPDQTADLISKLPEDVQVEPPFEQSNKPVMSTQDQESEHGGPQESVETAAERATEYTHVEAPSEQSGEPDMSAQDQKMNHSAPRDSVVHQTQETAEHSHVEAPANLSDESVVPIYDQESDHSGLRESVVPDGQEVIDISDDDDDDDKSDGQDQATPTTTLAERFVKTETSPEPASADATNLTREPESSSDRLPSLPPVESIEIDEAQPVNSIEPTDRDDEQMINMLNEFMKNTATQVPVPEDLHAESTNNDLEDAINAAEDIDSEAEDAQLKAQYTKAKRAYNAKVKAGKDDMKVRVEFQQKKTAEEARIRARKGKKAYVEEQSSMFFPEGGGQNSSSASDSDDESNDDEDIGNRSDDDLIEVAATSNPGKSSRRARAETVDDEDDIAATSNAGKSLKRAHADSVDDGDVEDNGASNRGRPSKRGRQGRGGAAAKGKTTAPSDSANAPVRDRGRGGRRRATRGRGRGGRKQQELNAFGGIESLVEYDTFGVANKNREAEAQPTTNKKNRRDALAELIASIPLDQRDQHVGDKKLLELSCTKFNGRGAMRADGHGLWRLRGMCTSLHHYQTIGAAKMRDRENAGGPDGGLLSDEMGLGKPTSLRMAMVLTTLGKTVMAIANMVDGRAAQTDKARATLIVAPAALQQQWMNEIIRHTDTKLGLLKNTFIYKEKPFTAAHPNPIETLAMYDVVITSYHEIIRSMPKREYPKELISARAKEEWWNEYFKKNKGLLHRVKWHRIILDEAQAIKNHTSRTSEGAWKLRGKYRWTLSGTPVVNSLEEFFAYFRFLKVIHTGDFEVWKTNFCKKGSPDALKRLKAMLENMMIRRTHKDTLFGRPIIQLPPIKPVRTIELDFSTFERALYKIVRERFITQINIWKSSLMTKNNYANIFILLLRLRQLVAHPLLIQKTLKQLLHIEDLEKLWLLTTSPEVQDDAVSRNQAVGLQAGLNTINESDPSANTTRHLDDRDSGSQEGPGSSSSTDSILHRGASVLTSADTQNGAGPPLSAAEVPSRFQGDISRQFRRVLKAMRDDGNWEKANGRSVCSACGQQPTDPYVTSCLHIYRFACLRNFAYQGLMSGQQEATCIECSVRFKKTEAYAVHTYDDAARVTPVTTARASRSRGSRANNPEEDIDWLTIVNPTVPSTKTLAAVKQIEIWMSESPIDGPPNKILLFSQFRGVLRIFSKIFDEKKWGHAQFHGAMSFDARNKAIAKFDQDPSCVILLAAMKAGGVGLNLTMANRVILVDLWWNTAMETQAFCRVFRIGQTRDVEVVRFAVRNTIDMDIIKMQNRKTLEIATAMERKNRVGNLTTEELLRLFGPLENQINGEQEDLDDDDDAGEGSSSRKQKKNKKKRAGLDANENENGADPSMSGYAFADQEPPEPFIFPDNTYMPADSDIEGEGEQWEGGMVVDDE